MSSHCLLYNYENGRPELPEKDNSLFSRVDPAPPVEIFALYKACNEDNYPMKVDLTIGAYRDEEGRPWVLPVVRKIEEEITSSSNLSHEYLGQLGLEELSTAATKLLLGYDSTALKENRAFGVQAVGGTGALRVGAEFLVKCAKLKIFYMADPCWPSHHLVFPYAGFATCRVYRYWHGLRKCLDIEGLLEDLNNAPEYSVVILHVCAHNPTGMDPSRSQWVRIADVMKERNLFPFFDCAYQGIASGDLDKDVWPVRYFVSREFELLCAQSFSKNMGLYSERVGNLTLVFRSPKVIQNVRSHITMMIRGNYCNPPRHGAGIATRILNDRKLLDDWKNQIKIISIRIKKMRWALRRKLQDLGAPGSWDHITKQIGMFCFSGLTEQQVQYLVQRYHIYIPTAGRINICGLNEKNVNYVAQAIYDACITFLKM